MFSPLMYEIVRSVARVYGWPDIEGAEEAELVDVPLSVLRSYVGSYIGTYKPKGEEAVEGIDFQVYLEGSGLMLRLAFEGGSGRMDLYPVASRDRIVGHVVHSGIVLQKLTDGPPEHLPSRLQKRHFPVVEFSSIC
ncbi:hypothetical protein SAMN06295888_1101 [Desulfonatronum zhilinae]|nr:hypothetical protein SAMN06295888_1101 [Desulfonatronum zhilinae]